MRPDVHLVAADLRANAIAWQHRAGVPLRAVVKADGYGWGVYALVDSLDGTVDGSYVSDVAEFAALRALTVKPIATLLDVDAPEIGHVLDAGGIPTISTAAGIDVAAAWARTGPRRARVRVAMQNATGWSGLGPDQMPALASALAGAPIDVELSSHITDETLRDEQVAAFRDARARFERAGVAIVAADIASTAPLAAETIAGCSHVRVGIGLFGARFNADVDVVSALRVRAPITDRQPARGQRTGYGVHRAPSDGYLAVLRCGYADGFPAFREPRIGILAVGMQFTTYHSLDAIAGDAVALVDRETDLDALARMAGIGPHQLVVALGNARRAARPPLRITNGERHGTISP